MNWLNTQVIDLDTNEVLFKFNADGTRCLPYLKPKTHLELKIEKAGKYVTDHDFLKRNIGQKRRFSNEKITQADVDYIFQLKNAALKELQDEIFYIQTGCILGETF